MDTLLNAQSRLDSGFTGCIVALMAGLGWLLYVKMADLWTKPWAGTVGWALVAVIGLTYVLFAVAAARAARALGNNAAGYLVWIVGAPLLGIVVILAGELYVGTAIFASPISLKILLGRELETVIHDRTFAD